MSFKMRRLYFNLSLIFLCVIFVKGENECGVIASTRSARIVGGEEIGFKYPWLATLVFTKDPKTIVCGGSLISEDYVLTAAHCYKPYISQKKQGKIEFEDIYHVKLGIDNQCREDENVGSYATKRVIIHEEYFQDLLFHDIALLNLDGEVNNFLPVCLPQIRYDDQERLKFKEGVIVGLGKERSTAWKLPCRVKEAVVPIQSDSNCRKMLEDQRENPNRVLGAFCAGYIEGNIDTCQGDSGGPLQIKMEDSKFMLLGITSFGYGCARPDVYGMYTDVSYYIDWIHGNMKKTEVKTTNTNNTIPPPQKMRYRGFLSQLLNW